MTPINKLLQTYNIHASIYAEFLLTHFGHYRITTNTTPRPPSPPKERHETRCPRTRANTVVGISAPLCRRGSKEPNDDIPKMISAKRALGRKDCLIRDVRKPKRFVRIAARDDTAGWRVFVCAYVPPPIIVVLRPLPLPVLRDAPERARELFLEVCVARDVPPHCVFRGRADTLGWYLHCG
jgi:hypothetical protein